MLVTPGALARMADSRHIGTMGDLTGQIGDGPLRLGVFFGVLVGMALLELLLPMRDLEAPKTRRWLTNFAIVGLDTAMLRLLFPILAVGVAAEVTRRGWGLFSLVDLPVWFEALICVILLDLAIYGQHVASHKIPLLWRVHKVHHSDRDIDVTTAIRFHPVEIALSMIYKFAVITVLGAGPWAVLLFEVLLNATAMFNHANIRLPGPLDAVVRLVVVTPDMHRVHHSVHRRETDSNYGFSLSVWDRLFRTYVPQPEDGHTGMSIGLEQYRDFSPARLWWSLSLPFRRDRPDEPDRQGTDL